MKISFAYEINEGKLGMKSVVKRSKINPETIKVTTYGMNANKFSALYLTMDYTPT